LLRTHIDFSLRGLGAMFAAERPAGDLSGTKPTVAGSITIICRQELSKL